MGRRGQGARGRERFSKTCAPWGAAADETRRPRKVGAGGEAGQADASARRSPWGGGQRVTP
jgi:hypothetical protein